MSRSHISIDEAFVEYYKLKDKYDDIFHLALLMRLVDDKGNTVFETIKNYTDTADEGSDYLCSICYGVYNKEAYVLDVYFTKQGMEITEPQTAKMLFENNEIGRAHV